jgi:hypothetical protein
VQQELLTGENALVDMQEHLKVSLEFIERLRVIFAGRTLRRTIHSTDNFGFRLWNLPPHVDITLWLRLSHREMNVILQLAAAASQTENKIDLVWHEVIS